MAGLGRPHMPQGSWAHGPQLLCYVLRLLKPTFPRALALQQEKPQQWDAHALPLESSRHSLQLEKAHTQQGRSSTGKNKYINKIFKNARKWKSICLVMQSLLAFRARWFGIQSFGGRLKSCNTRTRYKLEWELPCYCKALCQRYFFGDQMCRNHSNSFWISL